MLAINDAKIDPMPKNTHERVCKSCAPFYGSSLCCTQHMPSITTSMNAPEREIMKNKYMSELELISNAPLKNKHEDYTIANIMM